MAKTSHIIAGVIVVSGIGLVIWSLIRVQPTKPTDKGEKPKPEVKKPIISTDKTSYQIGEEILWTAENLVVGKVYGVGLWIDNTFTNDPLRDNFIAMSTSHIGRHKVQDFVPIGRRRFSLFEIVPHPSIISGVKYVEIASTIVEIVERQGGRLPPIILPIHPIILPTFETPQVITTIEVKRE